MKNPFKRKPPDKSLHGMGWISPDMNLGQLSTHNVSAAISSGLAKVLERHGGVPASVKSLQEIITSHITGKPGPRATPAILEVNRMLKETAERAGHVPMSLGCWNGPPGEEPIITWLRPGSPVGDASQGEMVISMRSELPDDEQLLRDIKGIVDAPDGKTAHMALMALIKREKNKNKPSGAHRGYGADPSLN